MYSALTHTVARCPNDENFPISRVRWNARNALSSAVGHIVVWPLRASHYALYDNIRLRNKVYASKSSVARLAATTRPQRRRPVIVRLLRTSRLVGNIHGTT